MNRLQTELQRLYFSHEPQRHTPDQGVRGMILELSGPASWDDLAKVWRGVQGDLQLPAPAIAVNGIDGFQLWFSFSVPTPVEQAAALLEQLRTRYLGDIAQKRIDIKPCFDAAAPGQDQHPMAPPVQRKPAQWSAFVAPDLAKLFSDEPWIDVAPGADAQADLLSRLESMKPEDVKSAAELPGPVNSTRTVEAGYAPIAASEPAVDNATPRLFLLRIMNDPDIELHLRIEAAKALLPYS